MTPLEIKLTAKKNDRERLLQVADPKLYETHPKTEWRKEAREQRARGFLSRDKLRRAGEAGFDINHIYYHGTRAAWNDGVPDFTNRRNWVNREWGDGLYLSESISFALKYARESFESSAEIPSDARLMAFVLHGDARIFNLASGGFYFFKRGKRGWLAEPAEVTSVLRRDGYDGLWNPTHTQLVIWNTSKLRHIEAAFDPKKRLSSDIFA